MVRAKTAAARVGATELVCIDILWQFQQNSYELKVVPMTLTEKEIPYTVCHEPEASRGYSAITPTKAIPKTIFPKINQSNSRIWTMK